MAKERESRKKEKKEKKEKMDKKMREAEVLEVKEKKISKKHKSESKKPEKTEKSKKKSKKSDVEKKSHKKSDESDVEDKSEESYVEEKPHKKSKESKRKHKTSDEPEEPETQIARSDDSHHVTVPTVTTNEPESDFEDDKEDIKKLLESYSKEELINLIYKTAEKGSRLISAVLESADRDSVQRNIFVRGLGWDTTQENLKAAFEVYGEIEMCSVVMDKDTGRAKGYGFVMFKTRKGAREALRNPEKRMYNRTVSCNLAAAKPSGVGKARDAVESVKIDLSQNEVPLPVAFDKGHQQQAMPMYAGQNMPFYQPPGFNPMYGPLMGNQMIGGLPNYHMFGSGLMNQMPLPLPPNHVGMTGQYAGDGNGVGNGFDGDRAWHLR